MRPARGPREIVSWERLAFDRLRLDPLVVFVFDRLVANIAAHLAEAIIDALDPFIRHLQVAGQVEAHLIKLQHRYYLALQAMPRDARFGKRHGRRPYVDPAQLK